MRVYSIAQLNDIGEGEESRPSSWGGAEAAGAAQTDAAEREKERERERETERGKRERELKKYICDFPKGNNHIATTK